MAQVSTSAAQHRAGASPILFGTILFLASELLFFGGLFGAYYALRAETSAWPPDGVELETLLAAVATALLVLSSGTFHLGLVAARREHRRSPGLDRDHPRAGSAVPLAPGTRLPRLSFEVSSHAYGTMYYAMTGLHWLTVAAGLVLMLAVLGRISQGAYRGGHIDGLHAVGYYWHFVDIVWIGLFATLFLVR